MKVSVIISVYNSHGVMARQFKHFAAMNLPDDVEFIIVDDGSNPPYNFLDYDLKNLRIYQTDNTLAWTQGIGRNLGAQHANGDYLFMTDADHILSEEAIQDVRTFSGSKMIFKRYFGVLMPSGTLTQDLAILASYGLDVHHLKPWRGLYASTHMNTFAIKRSIFEELGGYDPVHSLVGYHPVSRRGDDCYFNGKWSKYARRHGLTAEIGSDIYMFPIGRYHIRGETNPMGLFHDLKYDGVKSLKKGQEYE